MSDEFDEYEDDDSSMPYEDDSVADDEYESEDENDEVITELEDVPVEEPKPTASARPRLSLNIPKPAAKEKNYFASVKKDGLEMFSSGCNVLDCVLGGGFPLGRMSNIIGDRSSGKTLLAIEACSNFIQSFPNGKIHYFESEAAFDESYAEALGMPIDKINFVDYGDDNTVEFIYEFLVKLCKKATTPILFIIDSLDAVSDRAEKKRKIDEGSYAMGKQKKLSEIFRRLTREIENSSIHLMIISQVRENIGAQFGDKKSRSGGKALDFYASQIIWLAEIGKIKKAIKGVERPIGINVRVRCSKNKVGLPFRECEYPVYFGYGIDDIDAGLNFLESVKEVASCLEELGLEEVLDKIAVKQAKAKAKAKAKDEELDGDSEKDKEKKKKATYEVSASVAVKNMKKTIEGIRKMRKVVDKHVVLQWESIESGFLPTIKKY